MSSPLIRLVIPFTLGMVGANCFIGKMDLEVLFVVCCIVLAFSFFLIKTSQTYRDGKFGVVAIVLALLMGMALYTGKYRHTEQGIPQDTAFCQGVVVEVPKEKTRTWAVEVEQENGAHILLYIGKDREGLSIGDTILARIRHLNPTNHCENDTFRTYNEHLFHQGICATAYTPSDQCEVLACKSKRSLLTSAKALQEQLHDIYEEHGIKGEAGSIIEAMTIGRKANLSRETRTAYAHAGISHILALSGFHIGIIVLMIQVFFLKTALPLRWQWLSNIFIIATLWCYAILTGLSPSLVRATIMYTILLFCQSTGRNAFSINSCALAFFIMLCINPFYIHDIGFQLSFLAVGAISLSHERIIVSCPTHHSLLRASWSFLFITLLCTIFTAPLIAYHFGSIPTLSILSNIATTAFVYLLMWTSVLWWLFLWCEPINSLLTDLLTWTADTMNTLTQHISSLPFATIDWQPSILTTLLCYVLLLILLYRFQRTPIQKAARSIKTKAKA